MPDVPFLFCFFSCNRGTKIGERQRRSSSAIRSPPRQPPLRRRVRARKQLRGRRCHLRSSLTRRTSCCWTCAALRPTPTAAAQQRPSPAGPVRVAVATEAALAQIAAPTSAAANRETSLSGIHGDMRASTRSTCSRRPTPRVQPGQTRLTDWLLDRDATGLRRANPRMKVKRTCETPSRMSRAMGLTPIAQCAGTTRSGT